MKALKSLGIAAFALSLSPAALASSTDAAAVVKAATGVEDRQPVGESSQFKKGDRVFVWSQIKNADGQSVDHVWKRDGKEFWRAHFDVASASWRVNSRVANAASGSYVVDVTAGDDVLGSVSFTV